MVRVEPQAETKVQTTVTYVQAPKTVVPAETAEPLASVQTASLAMESPQKTVIPSETVAVAKPAEPKVEARTMIKVAEPVQAKTQVAGKKSSDIKGAQEDGVRDQEYEDWFDDCVTADSFFGELENQANDLRNEGTDPRTLVDTFATKDK